MTTTARLSVTVRDRNGGTVDYLAGLAVGLLRGAGVDVIDLDIVVHTVTADLADPEPDPDPEPVPEPAEEDVYRAIVGTALDEVLAALPGSTLAELARTAPLIVRDEAGRALTKREVAALRSLHRMGAP